MKATINYIILILTLCSSCMDRESYVEKSTLQPNDYRLFQGTKIWELAKKVQDNDVRGISLALEDHRDFIDLQDSIYGNTLLMLSIINQQYDSFKAIVDAGSNVNIHNLYNDAFPLLEASAYRQNDPRSVQYLIEHGALVNDTMNVTERGKIFATTTPLMAAAKCGNLSVVKILLDYGANIDFSNNIGDTALGETLKTNKFHITYYLLERGANYRKIVYMGLDEYGKRNVPINISTALRYSMPELHTVEHREKMKVIAFLKAKGINYDSVPIPKSVVNRAKEVYPNSWNNYLEQY